MMPIASPERQIVFLCVCKGKQHDDTQVRPERRGFYGMYTTREAGGGYPIFA